MKKTIRKLVAAVATAAMCCSVLVPVSAKAEEDVCQPHYYTYNFVREFYGGVYDHQYIVSRTEELDGTITIEYGTCWVDVIVTEYEKKCTKCLSVDGMKYEENHVHRVSHK